MADSLFGEGRVVYQTTTTRIVNGQVEAIEEGPAISLPEFPLSAEDREYNSTALPLKAGEILWLDDPYAKAAERIEEAKQDLISTATKVAAAVGSVIGITGKGVLPSTAEAPKTAVAHGYGEFGGEVGEDGLARFPTPAGTIPEDFKYTLFENGVQWEAKGVVRQYSFSEACLEDRKKTKQDSKWNKDYFFLGLILQGGGILKWRHGSFGEDAKTAWTGRTRKKVFCDRLELMTGIERELFLNYRRVGGYQPRFKLIDRRNEPLPNLAVSEAATKIGRPTTKQDERNTRCPQQKDELAKLLAEQAQDRRDDSFRDVEPRFAKRSSKREDY